MGSSQSQTPQFSYEDYNHEFQQIARTEKGIILLHRETEQQFFLKQMSFTSKTEYQRQLQSYHTMKRVPHSENVLSLVKVWAKQFNNFCSHSFKIYAVYQYPQITLRAEVESRDRESQPFEEQDLWSIGQSCVNALLEQSHELNLTPSNIFILSDGILKVIHEDIADLNWRKVLIKNGEAYYAPEKIQKFNNGDQYNDIEKEAVFSLGMTMMEASLLRTLEQCYDFEKYKFRRDKLTLCLKQLAQTYSPQFSKFLKHVLDPNPNARASLKDIQIVLAAYWQRLDSRPEHFSVDNSDASFTRKNRPSLSKNMAEFNKPKREQVQQIKSIQENFDNIQWSKTPGDMILSLKKQQTSSFKISQSGSFSGFNHLLPFCRDGSKEFKDGALFTDPKLLDSLKSQISAYQQSFQQSLIMPYQPNKPIIQDEEESQVTTNVKASQIQEKQSDKENQTPLKKQQSKKSFVNQNSIPNKTAFSKNPSQTLTEAKLNSNSKWPSRKNSQNIQRIDQKRKSSAMFRVQETQKERFQGLVIDGRREGYGKLVYQNGSYFEGAFKNNKIEGVGKLYTANGSLGYDGEWRDNKFNGRGVLYNQFCADVDQNSKIMFNDFRQLNFDRMEHYWTKYEGQFEKSLRHGNGCLYFINGDYFSGQFYKDKIQGQGRYVFGGQPTASYSQKGKIDGVWIQNKLQKIIN